MKSRKLSSSLQPSVASASKRLKYLVRLRRNASVSRRRPFKWAHWMLFKKESDCGWGQAPFEFLALSKDISACCKGRVAVLS